MRKISVCFCTPEYVTSKGGGIGTYVANLGRTLAEMGHEIHVITRYWDKKLREENFGGVQVHRVKARGPSVLYGPTYMYKCSKEVYKVCKENTIDLLHENLPLISTLFIKKNKLQKPLITTVHSTIKGENKSIRAIVSSQMNFNEVMFFVLNPIWALAEKKIHSYSDVIIAVSRTVAKELIQQYNLPKEKIQVIYNGVDVKRFHPQIDSMEIRRRYNISSQKVILYVGRLMSGKRLIDLIAAINLLKKEKHNVSLIVVGQLNRLARSLMSIVKRLGLEKNVIFTGYVSHNELLKYYATCDVFVLPSVYEGQPLTVLEAMACGKPVVATPVGGIPKIIINGETGLLVEPRKPSVLAEALRILLDDETLMKKIGINARQLVEMEYSWDVVARKTLSIYKSALLKQ